jgi:hypothetical protein
MDLLESNIAIYDPIASQRYFIPGKIGWSTRNAAPRLA